jgi:hypothetical protein
MHGRLRCHLAWLFVFILGAASGCASSVACPSESAGSGYDPQSAGSIHGRVLWCGDAPTDAPFRHRLDPGLGNIAATLPLRGNHFVPAIEHQSRGIGDAVVYLQGIDPQRALPWDHPPVRIEQRDLQLHVLQGERDGRIGFVRRGDAIEMQSCDSRFHALHACGAAWFTLAFPDPYQALSRPLNRKGIVELSSGAGYYWMRAFVFVDEHPYYTQTDKDGRFELKQVPPGRYVLVCLLPNWRETNHDRDPDTGLVKRLRFGPPLRVEQSVELGPRERREVQMAFGSP